MDDEIDIEEHDILEHPQVKAAFPDLSKIQIQVHTGASFLDDVSTHLDEFGSLLEERQDYADNDFEDETQDNDLSKTVQEEENELKEGTLDEEVSFNKEFMETHEISDSECIDDAPSAITDLIDDNLDGAEELNSKLHNTEDKVDEIEISEDELIDEVQYNTSNKLSDEPDEGMEIVEATEESADIAMPISKDTNFESNILELVDKVHEISDDEAECQRLTETIEIRDRLFEDGPENCNADEALANDNDFTEESPKNDDEFNEEGPTNETEMFIAENQEHESTGKDIISEQNENESNDYEVDLKNSEIASDVDEYQQVIKKEIEYDPENFSDFEETPPEDTFNNDELPPEDIYHFNNKIILGSKPSPEDRLDTRLDCKKYLVVKLEDWDVHLSRSQSYCEDCQTLFATPNALDAHRMIAHSLLAPITNRAVKSTAKSSINFNMKSTQNIAKKSTGLGNRDISNSTYCNHCNNTFKDHTTLIKHLYMLLPVKQYSCNICDASFQNQNDLVNHNSVHIKVESRKYLKAKPCSDNPLLRKMLSKEVEPIFSKAIKRSHLQETLTPSKAVKIKPIAVKEEPTASKTWSGRYQCTICSEIFDLYGQARKHRFTHPETKGQFLFQKIPAKKGSPNSKDKLIYEDDKSNIRKAVKNETSNANIRTQLLGDTAKTNKPFELIPKSALFQCSKCSLHFTSCVAGASHFTRNNCSDKAKWSCPTCKKALRKKDKDYHRKQHEISNKFKIYKITKTTYDRTLCKCLKCNVYFEYNVLTKHITKCGKIPTAKCKKCNILILKHKIAEHDKKHDVMKIKPKDFILIDYVAVNDKSKAGKMVASNKKTNTVDRKAIMQNNMAIGKKIKLEPEITIKTRPVQTKIVSKLKYENDKVRLYFCKHCKCFLSMRNFPQSSKLHLAKKCIGKYIYTTNCELCGLRLFRKTKYSHARLHERKKLTLNDFEFYDFATLKPITPSIPKYPACDKCHIHFLKSKMINNHICGEDYENCEVCGEKFENSALDVHLPFHQLLSSKRKPVASENPKIMPELIMKYESLNAIWNILFICGKCELVTDLYNKAVEHSQAHLKNDHCQPNTIKCYICNLKFDESCWSKHSELHSRMTLNNKDFKILKYMPKNLLDESWFQMFESLPEKEIRQIIDRSVFGSERSLKMRLIKDGLPEFTVYCCSICQVAYDNNDIRNHVKSKCNLPEHVCTVCDIAFDACSTLNFHELLHKKGIKKNEFRIVNFVKISNDTIKHKQNKKVKSAKTDTIVRKKSGLKVKKKLSQKKGSQFILYKCEECSACVLLKKNQSTHVCTPEDRQDTCKICKQNFASKQMGSHKEKHIQQPEFRANNIKIVTFEPRRNRIKNNIIRQSSRKPKRILARSISSDSDQNLYSSDIEPTTSSNSNKRRTQNSSKHHDNLHRVSVESSDTDLETNDEKTAKVYKCDCGLHYTSLRTIEKHIETCDSSDTISKEACSKCGLLFPTDILVSHLCKHHSRNTKITVEKVHKSRETEVTSTKPKANTSTAKETIKLYKCSDCNVYFLNQNSCYKHTHKHEPLDPKQYIECKMCCLQFRILSLHIHMKKHHESEFNFERVLVEEYQPSTSVKGAPKIDIYFANEKIQNVQVSSSNDT